MSLPPLSDAQRAAVEHAFADALVTAGAGSGKTRVLSERFVHLVRGGAVDLRRLAALTFTEKAAAQMRERIADLFQRLSAAAPDTDAERWDMLRADVEFAPISTIHSFCALLLRQHAVEAGVDPAFEVLDAVEADLLLEDAAQLAENQLAAEDPQGVALLGALAGEPRKGLLKLLETVRGAGVAPDAITWCARPADANALRATAEEALGGWEQASTVLKPAERAAHADAVALTADALATSHAGTEAAPFLVAQAEAAVRTATLSRKAVFTKPRKALQEALAALRAALLDVWIPTTLLEPLRQVLCRYNEAYSRLKRERSALDFIDLELCARDLLQRASDVNRPLDLAPRGLLVDEFQDTNPLQADILALLRSQAPQFSVGDPKQSIYGFRGADVGVILGERARIGEAAVHPMNASYRACAPLVAAVNGLNARLFENDAAGVTYEPLEAAATYLDPDGPVCELTVIDMGRGPSAAEARAHEAAWIAARIRALVESGTPRLRPHPDDPGRSAGPLRYGDVAVLFRAAGDLPIYEHALAAEGVPYLTQKSRGYFQADEISELLYVLRAVHNPEDRFALAATAAGPALAASDAELLRWFRPASAAEDTSREGTPWARMQAEADAGGRHQGAVATLRALRREAAGGSLATAVERTLTDLGLYEVALLMPGGDRRAANLRKAVAFARQLDRGGRRGLADLLRHLATMRDREAAEAEAPVGGEDDDVVRLTTVHGAKGLEYPVVFLADIGRKPGGGAPDPILFDGEGAIAAKVKDPLEGLACAPGGHEALAARAAAADAAEELRVLYVAMTRAEERLVMSAWCQGITGTRPAQRPSQLQGWGKHVWAALGVGCSHGTQDLDVEGAIVRTSLVERASVEVPERPPLEHVLAAVGPQEHEAARAVWLAASAPTQPLGDTRYVVSVSELLTFAESPQRYYRDRVVFAGARTAAAAAWDTSVSDLDGVALERPEAGRDAERIAIWDEPLETHAGVDRAALGRAVHMVLEHVRAQDDTAPEGWLEQAVLAEGGDAAFADAVRTMVERFLTSPTGQRMRAALAAGEDVRREVALHARIRFPGGQPVGGFDSLLVKGSIDLWLPSEEGVWIVDHKTNRAGSRFRAPEDLAEHYAWQLRLYALAVERVLGHDVAGARLLLLDPGWGAQAVEVPVDVSGPALEQARQLCQAFAVAELEGRYPAAWTSLLA